jgi:hypothetical protein
MKSTVESDELLASYIAHLEWLEDLEKIGLYTMLIMNLIVLLVKLILKGPILA